MDATLRGLLRAWLEGRTLEAETRYLRERLRRGELARERLELCAWLGHAPAAQALDGHAPAGEHVPWEAWAAQLDPSGRAIVYEEYHALAMRGLEGVALIPELAATDAAIRAWCACPCEAHRAAVVEVYPGAEEALQALFDQPIPPRRVGRMSRITGTAMNLTHEDLGIGFGHQLSSLCIDDEVDLEHVGARLVGHLLGVEHRLVHDPSQEAQAREVAFLRQRLADGELSAERLRLAAYADHAPARAALEAAGLPAPEVPAELAGWLLGLEPWGRAVAVRAVMVVADTFVHADVAGEGWWGVWGHLAARGPLQQVQALVESTWEPIFESRIPSPEREAEVATRLEQAARQLEIHAHQTFRLRLVPGLRARLRHWVDMLRAHDDLARAARACAFLHADIPPLISRWDPLPRARRETIEEALRPSERRGGEG